ncbi:MAG: hypothetical protein ABI833_14180 [Acidobacteriota bacterium]
MKGTAPAILFLYVLDAVLLTVPASLILIWLYRRTVERAMHAASTAGESTPSFPVASPPRESWNPVELRNRERRLRLRLALVYAFAGASAAAVWTWLYFQTPDLEFAGIRGFAVWYVFCWPVPATFITLWAIPWRRSMWVVAAYLGTGMLVIAIWSAVSHPSSGEPGFEVVVQNLQSFLFLLALEASLPASIILIASNRRIRGVSPLALAALLVFTFSSVAAREIFVTLLDVGNLRTPLLTIGPNGWFMLATVPVGYLCWRLLALLNGRYRRKSFSDVQLVADLFWVIAAFVFSAQYASAVGWKGIAGLAGFVAYRAIAQLGLAIWRPSSEPGMRLLILRVFGFRGRTEKLFDSVAQRWRFRGGVAMIAGTDLAARTIDPDDTLAFLAGDLSSRFVQGSQDLEERLKSMDESRDPDGRFRVTEFFCHENTWSNTLAALLGQSDAILMDLRGFSERNSGCIFELHQLITQRRLDDTVFVVDASTDVKLLESTVGNAKLGSDASPRLRLENVGSGVAAERERVYGSLCQAHQAI